MNLTSFYKDLKVMFINIFSIKRRKMICCNAISSEFGWQRRFGSRISFKNLIIAVCCLSLMTAFFSTCSAQETFKDTTEMPHVSIAFHRTMLVETDIKDIHSAIEVWVKTVGRNASLNFESTLYENINPLLRDYKSGKIDVLNIAPQLYLRIENEIDAEPAYLVIMGGKKTRRYLLLTRSDSPVNDIKDLKGKNLAVMSSSEIGNIFLNVLLLREKLGGPEYFFSTITQKAKFSQTVLSVFFGQSDACIVTETVLKTMTELNPQIGNKLKIIAASPEITQIVGFFRPDLSEKIKKIVLREVTHLQDSAVGRQVLTLFGIDGALQASESDLDTMRELIKEYDELLRKK